MEIKQATREDIDQIVAIRSEFLEIYEGDSFLKRKEEVQESIKKFMLEEMSKNAVYFYFAMDGDKIAGTSAINIQPIIPNAQCITGKNGYILNIYVRDDYRRQGLATKLLSKAVEKGVEEDCASISLHATEMGAFVYEKFGFIKKDDEMLYYPKKFK